MRLERMQLKSDECPDADIKSSAGTWSDIGEKIRRSALAAATLHLTRHAWQDEPTRTRNDSRR